MRQALVLLFLLVGCQSQEEVREDEVNERGVLQDYVETPKEKARGVKQKLERAQDERDEQLEEE